MLFSSKFKDYFCFFCHHWQKKHCCQLWDLSCRQKNQEVYTVRDHWEYYSYNIIVMVGWLAQWWGMERTWVMLQKLCIRHKEKVQYSYWLEHSSGVPNGYKPSWLYAWRSCTYFGVFRYLQDRSVIFSVYRTILSICLGYTQDRPAHNISLSIC